MSSMADWQVLQVDELAGQGLRALVRSEVHWGGTTRWVRLGSCIFARAEQWSTASSQAVYLAIEEADQAQEAADVTGSRVRPVAAWVLEERIRAEAVRVVQCLRADHLEVQLLSGDGAAAVQRVAQAVGIERCEAACSPASKLECIQALQTRGHTVGMVGDGLNDGPVLAGADVSFAFGRAVPLAQAKSDFVVLSDNLELIERTVMLARKTLRVVRQNLLGSALYNAVCIPLAMVGWMPAWLAGLGMALSSMLVVLNAARLAVPVKLKVAEAEKSVASSNPAVTVV